MEHQIEIIEQWNRGEAVEFFGKVDGSGYRISISTEDLAAVKGRDGQRELVSARLVKQYERDNPEEHDVDLKGTFIFQK